jgi:hypothetical protein
MTAAENNIPMTVDEADARGAISPTEEEFGAFIRQMPDLHTFENRVADCTVQGNEGQLCWRTGCYQGQMAMVYCRNGRCDDRRFLPC